jgi:hypothetical protein
MWTILSYHIEWSKNAFFGVSGDTAGENTHQQSRTVGFSVMSLSLIPVPALPTVQRQDYLQVRRKVGGPTHRYACLAARQVGATVDINSARLDPSCFSLTPEPSDTCSHRNILQITAYRQPPERRLSCRYSGKKPGQSGGGLK